MGELQPPIFIGDLRIGEPTTAVTDFLVTAVCFYAYVKLDKLNAFSSKKYFQFYFLFLGLATFWGGLITHALIYYLSTPWKVAGWIMSTWSVSLLAWAMVEYHTEIIKKWVSVFKAIILIELTAVMAITIYSVEFKWAGAHSAFGLFMIVTTLAGMSYHQKRDTGSRWMLYGIGIFLLSGITFSAKLSIHTWFNHVDLTHVFLALAAWAIYRSVVMMSASVSAKANSAA
jgi:hypothetical protein